jgi:hypothetical protein
VARPFYGLSAEPFCDNISQRTKKEQTMAKSHDVKRDTKKAPSKTLKEKRAAKKEKKASKA